MNRARASAVVAAVAMMGLAACSSPSVHLSSTSGITHSQAQATLRPAATAAPGQATTAAPGAGRLIPGSGALNQFQDQLRTLADSVLPSIVQITTSTGLGSGIVFDSSGDIVTNNHVVEGARSLVVTASDGKQAPATLVGTYPANDLAVIHVAPAAGLTPAAFADSAQVRVGDVVLAIGSPFGLGDTVTEGIVSAVGRTQSEGNGVVLSGLVQISAPINPGNSGGALIDIHGNVVGIPTLGGTDSQGPNQGSQGIGFAINANQVTSAARQIVSDGSVTHTGVAYLGVTTRNSAGGGVGLAAISAGSPADRAGLQAGEVITAINGHPVADAGGLSQILSGLKPGAKVQVTVTVSDGSSKNISLTLGERPVNS